MSMFGTLFIFVMAGMLPTIEAMRIRSPATAMPPVEECVNIDVEECKDELKDNFSSNIYEMCCDDEMAKDCCAFCKEKLTCDAENNAKRDIIEMQMKYKYLSVQCSDTVENGICQGVHADRFSNDTCEMCKEQVYGDICCSYCKKEVNSEWNSLMINEIITHPLAIVDSLVEFPSFDFMPIPGVWPGLGCSQGNCGDDDDDDDDDDAVMDKLETDNGPKMIQTGHDVQDSLYGQSLDDDIDDEKLKFLPHRNKKGDRVCVNTIGESQCEKMTKKYHSGLVHKMCTEPHNRLVCCAFCRDQLKIEKMNRKKRGIAFDGNGLYPLADNKPCCDLIGSSTCTSLLNGLYGGCAKRMCTSFHYGMMCCNTCKNIATTPAPTPACENTLGDSGCKTILKGLFYGCMERMCRPGYYSKICCKMCEDAGYDRVGHGTSTGLGGLLGGILGGYW